MKNATEENLTNPVSDQGPRRFRGRFELKLDPKGRLSLPSAYRRSPSSSDNPEQFIVTNSRFQAKSCLHVYSLTEWENLENKISQMSALNRDVQAFNRFYLAGGQATETDSQNRILIPQSLRQFADLDGPVVLVGMGSKFEIWSQTTWNQIYETLTETFEETLATVASLDGGGHSGQTGGEK
jgi:MraZ protein